MLYVSMALVISGVVLVLFSLFFESEVSVSRPPADRYVPPMDEAPLAGNDTGDDLAGVSDELDLEIDDFTMLEDEDLPVLDEDEEDEGEEIAIDENAENADTTSDKPLYNVVLYEDPERISVGDTAGNGEISADDVSRFSRIGEGTIEVLRDGINIRIGKRLYHFDFNKIDRVYAGTSYIVLTLQATDVARVVMFQDYDRLPGHVLEQLNNLIDNGL